ncbi:MAG: hypothetical protein R3E98_05885 [Gemmatimonadota bacterium]|nr:hypothetical protein [Gemmatimonadota bacterium]
MPKPIAALGALVAELVEGLEDGTLAPGFTRPLRRGSAEGEISIVPNPRDPSVPLLLITLEIMAVPPDGRGAFFRRLLELNGTLFGRASFWVGGDDRVRLVAGRPMEDLDPSELVDLVLWTSEQADQFDDLLVDEFGGEARR